MNLSHGRDHAVVDHLCVFAGSVSDDRRLRSTSQGSAVANFMLLPSPILTTGTTRLPNFGPLLHNLRTGAVFDLLVDT